MSVSNILSTNTTAKTWKNINVGNIVCTSITSDGGIAADNIKCVGVIPIKQTAPINNQALIYNSTISQLEFQTLIDNTGITTLNGCSGLVQSFATATDPINGFQITSNPSTNTHTFRIGDASATKRGFVSTSAQSFSGVKTFLNDIIIGGNVIYGNNYIANSQMIMTAQEIIMNAPRISTNEIDANDFIYMKGRPVISGPNESLTNCSFNAIIDKDGEILTGGQGMTVKHQSPGEIYIAFSANRIYSVVANIDNNGPGIITCEHISSAPEYSEWLIHTWDQSFSPWEVIFNICAHGFIE
jgi:hypothetical protein